MLELHIIKNSFYRIIALITIVAFFACTIFLFLINDTTSITNEILIIVSFGIFILAFNSFPIYNKIGKIVFEESGIQLKFINAEDKYFTVNKNFTIFFDDRGYKGALHSTPFLGIPLFQKDGVCNLYLSDGSESFSIKILIRKNNYKKAIMLINKYESASSS